MPVGHTLLDTLLVGFALLGTIEAIIANYSSVSSSVRNLEG